MPIKPSDQTKAMITIQKGPKLSSKEGSISMDSSSIEPAVPLEDITRPKNKEKENKKKSVIIGFMGLDSLANAIGFEDFKNYFTLRSVESDLCQEIVFEHLKSYNLDNDDELKRIRLAMHEIQVQRIYSNQALQLMHQMDRLGGGITPRSSKSYITSLYTDKFQKLLNHSVYSFKTAASNKVGGSTGLSEDVEKFLGIENIDYHRPTFQYLKLLMELDAQMIPRTAPMYYAQANRILGLRGATVSSYGQLNQGLNSSDLHREGAFVEMTHRDLIRAHGISPDKLEHGFYGLKAPNNLETAKPWHNFSRYSHVQNLSAMLYIMQRDYELSVDPRSNGSMNNSLVGMPGSGAAITLEEAFDWASTQDYRHAAGSLSQVPASSIEIETKKSEDKKKYFRIFNLEYVGIEDDDSDRPGRGNSRRNPIWISPGQLQEKMFGTSAVIANTQQIVSQRVESADNANNSIEDVFKLKDNNGSNNPHVTSITYIVSEFLFGLSDEVNTMMHHLENLTPAAFEPRLADNSAEGNHSVYDAARGRFHEDRQGEGDILETASHGDIIEGDASAALRQSNKGKVLSWNGNMRRMIQALKNGGAIRANDVDYQSAILQVELLWDQYVSRVSEDSASFSNSYNAARNGVFNMDSSLAANWSDGFKARRPSMGFALVLSAMKNRNTMSSNGDFTFFNKLYSRFKAGIYSQWLGDLGEKFSSDENISNVSSRGRKAGKIGGEGQVNNSDSYNKPPSIAIRVPTDSDDTHVYKSGRNRAEHARNNSGAMPIKGSGSPQVRGEASCATNYGYIKGGRKSRKKFYIPSVRNTFLDQSGNYTASMSDWEENDIAAITDNAKKEGIHRGVISSATHNPQHALNMAPGQAEEYYDMGWSLIGKMVASILSEYISGLNSQEAIQSGLTKSGSVGIETYILVMFEILGTIADCIPIYVMNSSDHNAESGATGKAILLDDADIREAYNRKMNTDYSRATQSLFTSKSGVDGLIRNDATFEALGINEEDLGNAIDLRATEFMTNVAKAMSFYNDYGRNAGMVDETSQTGERVWHIISEDDRSYDDKSPMEFLDKAIEHASEQLREHSSIVQDSQQVQDIALIVPSNLRRTITLPESPYNGLSSFWWIKNLAYNFKMGGWMYTSEGTYEEATESYAVGQANWESKGGDVVDSIEAMESYMQGCEDNLKRFRAYPSMTSIQDIYKIQELIWSNETHKIVTGASLMTYNQYIISMLKDVNENINLLKDPFELALRAKETPLSSFRNAYQFKYFDWRTRDRPIRTLSKLLPKGIATKEIPSTTKSANDFNPGVDFTQEEVMSLLGSTEYSNETRNLVISYLDAYPIEDTREVILAAGCPAGTDTKNLSEQQGTPMRINPGRVSTETNRQPGYSSIKRIFRVTGQKDIYTNSRLLKKVFHVEKQYQTKYFLLPESFDEFDDFTFGDESFLRSVAKQAKWFEAPSVPPGTDVLKDPVQEVSWSSIVSRYTCHDALDDMVESYILQWLVAMTSGVLIDQDLIFDKTNGTNSMDLVRPCTDTFGKRILQDVDGRSEVPVLGCPTALIDEILVTNDISWDPNDPSVVELPTAGAHMANPNFLTPFKYGDRVGFPKNFDAANLVLDTKRTELDPVTGAELEIPIVAPVKPWNIRLASAVLNSYTYRCGAITGFFMSKPAFDYTMLIRLKKKDFEGTATSNVDILSYRVTIGNSLGVEHEKTPIQEATVSQSFPGRVGRGAAAARIRGPLGA